MDSLGDKDKDKLKKSCELLKNQKIELTIKMQKMEKGTDAHFTEKSKEWKEMQKMEKKEDSDIEELLFKSITDIKLQDKVNVVLKFEMDEVSTIRVQGAIQKSIDILKQIEGEHSINIQIEFKEELKGRTEKDKCSHLKYVNPIEITRLCEKHRKCTNHVCTDHKEAICDECFAADHNQCSIQDITSSLASYEHLRWSIASKLETELKQLQYVNHELLMFDRKRNSAVSRVRKTYDALKEQYMDKVQRNEENLQSAVKELEERKMKFENIIDKVRDIKLDTPTLDNLLLMLTLRKLAEENIENFKKMCKKESLANVNQNFDSFVINVNKGLIDLAFDPIRNNIFLNIIVDQITSFSINPSRLPNNIRGCTIRSNNEMCFVDARNDRVVIVKVNGQQSNNSLPGRPFDVTNGSQGLIVTLRQNRSICFFDPDPITNPTNFAEQVKFSVKDTGSVGGISREGDTIVVAVECFGFYILDFKGEIKKKIQIKDDINIQYVASGNNKIFYTKSEENRVYCCDHQGDILWMFEDERRMKTPTGITLDEDGCVYVLCLNSNNVFVISQDGQFGKELLVLNNGMHRSYAIDYNPFTKRILICSENGIACVYNVQKLKYD